MHMLLNRAHIGYQYMLSLLEMIFLGILFLLMMVSMNVLL